MNRNLYMSDALHRIYCWCFKPSPQVLSSADRISQKRAQTKFLKQYFPSNWLSSPLGRNSLKLYPKNLMDMEIMKQENLCEFLIAFKLNFQLGITCSFSSLHAAIYHRVCQFSVLDTCACSFPSSIYLPFISTCRPTCKYSHLSAGPTAVGA